MSNATRSGDRGRTATRPHHIPQAGWKDILLRTKDELSDDHVSVVSAGVAFFGLLAAFPAIAAIISIAGLIVDPAVIESQIEAWAAGLPEDAAEILQAQARKVATGANAALGWAALLSILLALYGASKGMKTLMEGMNVAYDEDEKRGFVRLNAIALMLTVLLILALLIAIAFMLGIPVLLDSIGISANWEAFLTYARWLVLAIIAVGGLSVLYRYGPSRDDPKWRWTTPGSTLAIVIWIAGSIGFSFYVCGPACKRDPVSGVIGV
jgi:membrane protein